MAGLLVVLVAAQVAMLVLSRAGDAGPTDLDIGVTGPAIVAQSVVDRAGTLEDDPMDATVVVDEQAGRDLVRDGTLDAVVVLDLTVDTDRLLVSSAADPDVVAGLTDYVEAVSASYARTVRLERVDPARNAGAWRGIPVVLTVAWTLAGMVLAVAVTMVGGPVASTARAGRRRTALIGAVSLADGLLSALLVLPWVTGATLVVVVAGTLCVFAGAAFTLALESLAGLAGIGLSATVVVGPLLPLLTLTPPELLHPWMAAALDLTPPWAARELLLHATYVGGLGAWRPLGVLAAWCVIPVVTLVTARRARPVAAGTVAA